MRTTIGVLVIGCIGVFLIGATVLWYALQPRTESPLPTAEEFLSWPDCKVPCWRGIKPGVSTERDVMRALAIDESIRSVAVRPWIGEPDLDGTLGYRQLVWVEPRNGQSNLVILRRELVELVRVSNYSQLTLGDVVLHFGNPEHVLAELVRGERIYSGILAYAPRRGAVVSMKVPYQDRVKLDPALSIDYLYYFEPTTEERMWQLPGMTRGASISCIRANWVPWPGWEEITTLPYGRCTQKGIGITCGGCSTSLHRYRDDFTSAVAP